MKLYWMYMLAVNLLAFLLYGIDKRKAVKDRWRISEATLLGVAFAGGGLGSWVAMKTFRHKTKHWKFKILVPVSVLLHIALFIYFTINL